jgi:hypothetical protein
MVSACFGRERGITRRCAPRPSGAALRVLAWAIAGTADHLDTGYSSNLAIYPAGVIPLRRGSTPERMENDAYRQILAERGIRTLEGLSTF